MFLKTKSDGSLVEVLAMDQLINPFEVSLEGRLHAGEELQDPEVFAKGELLFPSGETLPLCWLTAHPLHN